MERQIDIKAFDLLLGRALVDSAMREELLARSSKVLVQYGMPQGLAESLSLDGASSLEDLARLLLPLLNGHED